VEKCNDPCNQKVAMHKGASKLQFDLPDYEAICSVEMELLL
jgi:hypothetical protein